MNKITFLITTVLLCFMFNNAQAQFEREGTFVAADPANYPISGTTAVQFLSNGTHRVVFKSDFATIQGLRLEVFLSKTGTLNTTTDVKISTQELQDDNGGTDMNDPITGFKIFEIPAGITLAEFDYVIVQCTQANLLWGSAALGGATALDHCERSGSFVAADPANYPVSGSARIEFLTDGTKQVIFDDNFATIQGLRLEVFLSKTGTLNTTTDVKISVQELQDDNGGTDMNDPITGFKRFEVPAAISLEEFDYIIIQCTQANLLWGSVALSADSGSGCSVLDVEDVVFREMKIYPNPVKDQVIIQNPLLDNFQINVYDIRGTQVFSSEVASNEVLDLSGYASGVYVMEIIADNKKTVRRLVKE